MSEKTRDVIAAYDAAHPHWREERREAMEREAKVAEERARRAQEARHQAVQQRQQQQAEDNSKAWCSWVDARIKAHFEQWFAPMFKEQCDPLHDAIGQVISTERATRRKEVETPIAEERRSFETKLTALEQHIVERIIQHNEQRMAQWLDQTVNAHTSSAT